MFLKWRRRFAAVLITGGLSCLTGAAADWPSFRGPNASGVAECSGLPLDFGPGKSVLWETAAPNGNSSPVIAGDRIFLTGHDGEKLLTLCLNRATGETLWRREVTRQRSERLHNLNSPASATPATDGENVYAFFGDFGLVSYSFAGEERWRLPLGPFDNLHGMAGSPILHGGRLILACDQDTNSFLLAVDKETGKTVWKTPRPEVVHGFSTPSVFHPPEGEAQIIVPGSYWVLAYSESTGEKLWSVRGLTWQVKPTAVVHDGTIYVTGWAPGAEPAQRRFFPPFDEAAAEADANRDGKIAPEELPEKWKPTGSWLAIDLDRDGFLNVRDWSFYRARRSAQNVTMAIRPGAARGDLTDSHVLWSYDRGVPVVSSPLLYRDVLYTVKDGGILTAFAPHEGRVLKMARVRGAIDKYYASPVAADGKIFLASETGKVAVIKPGPQWEVLAVNDLGEPVYATPAIVEGNLYIRTERSLYAFGKRD